MLTIISATNRQSARSYQLALFYQKLLQEKDTPSQIIDLQQLPEDFTFSALYENNGKNSKFNQLISPLSESEKIVFIIPEYNGSFPGILKSFVDGLSYPSQLSGKKVALVGISSGSQGSALALSHFADILNYLGSFLLPMRVRLPFIESHLVEGTVIDDDTYAPYNALLEEQIDKLIAF